MDSEKLEWFRSNGKLLDPKFDRLAIIGDKMKAKEVEKKLSIKYNSSTIEDEKIYLEFSIETPTIKSSTATIFVEEMNADNEIAVPKTIVTGLKSNSKQSFKVSFDKNKIFNRYTFQDNFSYQATVTIDGLSAKTDEFELKYEKKKPEKEERCLCKKSSWTADDLRNIVTQLRKLDVEILNNIDKHDITFHHKWLDKDGKLIPDTDTGKKPKNGDRKKYINVISSFYDKLDSNSEQIKDRLFYLKNDDLNIKSTEAKYEKFVNQLNRIFVDYKIDNCLRKLHFMAQIYQETQRFTKTYEQTDRIYFGGNFYQGRGLKQITHDYNYLKYYCHKSKDVNKKKLFDIYIEKRKSLSEGVNEFNERTSNEHITVEDMTAVNELAKKISTDIYYAADSAGWYWLDNNINEYADKDSIIGVSAKVNNPDAKDQKTSDGINGFSDREKYYNLLKIIFDYENCK
jgi:predicted chitinase